MFVIPAFISGSLVSLLVLKAFSILFLYLINLEFAAYPTFYALMQALIVGVLIPIGSSIIPILKITKMNLTAALDYNRSKV